jgi:capsular exopolysaccharide synthesis family protein
MGRVFDALKREQKRKNRDGEHDPLAKVVATHEAAATETETFNFDPSAPIGTPVGRRSNDGMLLPGGFRTLDEQTAQTRATETAKQIENLNPPRGQAHSNGNGTAALATLPVVPYQPPQTRPLDQPVALTYAHPSEVHARIVMLSEPHIVGCEQYRTLRTQLFQTAEHQLTQVIVVTSALAGEGKTSTTLNLAFAIAQSPNRRVLVIDGDLRRPSIGNYLNVQPVHGFGEVLTSQVSVFDALTRIADHELYVLPVKNSSEIPTESLTGESYAELIRQVREHFDFILIDSPPVMPFADARLLANQADGVMMVVRAGFAPYETVEQATEAMSAHRLLGAVLNGAENLRETRYYSDYLDYSKEHSNGNNGFGWQTIAPRLRDTWLGRRFKL